MNNNSITEAKRLIALSPEGARLLGAGLSGPCSRVRYARAAQAALADPDSGLTPEERRLIASHLAADSEEGEEGRECVIRARVTAAELEEASHLAREAGLSLSELIRRRVLYPDEA